MNLLSHVAAARAAVLTAALLLVGCAAPRLPPGAAGAAAEPVETAPSAARERQTYLAVISRLREGGQHYAAYAHLLALEARYGGGSDVTALKADALRASGDAAAAAALYARLLDTPLAGKGFHGLGLLAGARHDYAAAARLFERAAARDSTAAELQSDLGYALLRSGRIAEARRPLMTASELAPQDARIQANLALYRSLEAGAPAAVPLEPLAPRALSAAEALRLALGPGSEVRRAEPAGEPRAVRPGARPSDAAVASAASAAAPSAPAASAAASTPVAPPPAALPAAGPWPSPSVLP